MEPSVIILVVSEDGLQHQQHNHMGLLAEKADTPTSHTQGQNLRWSKAQDFIKIK